MNFTKIKKQYKKLVDSNEQILSELKEKYATALNEDEDNLSTFVFELEWYFRDTLFYQHVYAELRHLGAILGADADKEQIEDELRDHLVNMRRAVMREDTLNYSTSPEKNMDDRAKYKALRYVYWKFAGLVLGEYY